MIVLTRRRDEGIVIGDNIHVTIVEVRHDKVRIGIETPKDMPVHRREVYDAIQRQPSPTEPPPVDNDKS